MGELEDRHMLLEDRGFQYNPSSTGRIRPLRAVSGFLKKLATFSNTTVSDNTKQVRKTKAGEILTTVGKKRPSASTLISCTYVRINEKDGINDIYS